MDDFPLKLNDIINAFVAHNWIAVAVLLAVLAGLSKRCGSKWITGIYSVFRDAWKVVRPPSNDSKDQNGQ